MTPKAAQFLSIASLTCLVGCGPERPKPIEQTVQPGTAISIPFAARPEGARVKALSSIPASPIFDPTPLPQGVEILQSSLLLHGSGRVVGDILVYIPTTATGEVAFSIVASGQGNNQTAAITHFQTSELAVVLSVDPTEPSATVPLLKGTWRGAQQTWEFDLAESGSLQILAASGDDRSQSYQLYPDGAERWYLVDTDLRKSAYWIELDEGSDQMHVAWIGAQFKPFLTLSRE